MKIEELKGLRVWLNWNYEEVGGKQTKVPYSFMGKKTGTTDNYKDDWCDYKTAKVQVDDYTASGIGLILAGFTDSKKSLVAIDIDHRNKDDPYVKDIVAVMNTYTEVSPSGNGFHLLFLVDITKLPADLKDKYYMKNTKLGIECYIGWNTNRFMTFTGDVFVNKDVEERTEELMHFLTYYMSKDIDFSEVKEETPTESIVNNNVPTNNKAIENMIFKTPQAEKFAKLFYDGDISDYNGDDSSADMALADILAYYIGNDVERIAVIMKQSALKRDKWELHKTYLEETIKKAVEFQNGNFFNWNGVQQETQKQGISQLNKIKPVTARELQEANIEPPVPVIENLLYPGLVVLAGPPKIGKSWICLDIGNCVATGAEFLGNKTTKAECLYLALEDGPTRLKQRINKGLDGKPAPNEFHIATNCSTLDFGLLSELQEVINQNHNIKLIIIDTFQKVRGQQSKNNTLYGNDYNDIGKIKEFADINQICVLLIHHLRKMKDTDVFNQISGSTGLTGAADTMIVLTKQDRGNSEILMSVTGRDIDTDEKLLTFNKELCKWQILSNTGDMDEVMKQSIYRRNPIVQTIKKLVEEQPQGFRITATDLLKKIFETTGTMPKQDKPQTLSREINENLQFQLYKYDNIYYEQANKNGGSSGRQMYFSLNGVTKTDDENKSDTNKLF